MYCCIQIYGGRFRRMFRYVDALCLLPLTMYPKTHTHTHTHTHTQCELIIFIKQKIIVLLYYVLLYLPFSCPVTSLPTNNQMRFRRKNGKAYEMITDEMNLIKLKVGTTVYIHCKVKLCLRGTEDFCSMVSVMDRQIDRQKDRQTDRRAHRQDGQNERTDKRESTDK